MQNIPRLLELRKQFHSIVIEAAAKAADVKVRRTARDVAYISADPDRWHAAVGLTAYATTHGISPTAVIDQFATKAPRRRHATPMYAYFTDQPELDPSSLDRVESAIVGEGLRSLRMSTLLLTRYDLCEMLCGKGNDDCITRCDIRTDP